MGAKFFEVLFRGAGESKLLVWWPEGARPSCTATEARERHNELLSAANAEQTIDGFVPAVIEIRQVKIKQKKLAPVDGNGRMGKKGRHDVRIVETMLLTFVDGTNDISHSGPWSVPTKTSTRDLN